MPSRNRNTFGHLSTSLKALGFTSVRRSDHVVFSHSSGRPVILLPSYASGQAVKPIHLLMVRKQLDDAGILKTVDPSLRAKTKVEAF